MAPNPAVSGSGGCRTRLIPYYRATRWFSVISEFANTVEGAEEVQPLFYTGPMTRNEHVEMGSQGRTFTMCPWPPSPGPDSTVWFPPAYTQQQSWTVSNSIVLAKQNVKLLLTLSIKYYPSPLLCLKLKGNDWLLLSSDLSSTSCLYLNPHPPGVQGRQEWRLHSRAASHTSPLGTSQALKLFTSDC